MERFRAGVKSVSEKLQNPLERLPQIVRGMYDVMDNLPYYGKPREYHINKGSSDFEDVVSRYQEIFLPANFGNRILEKYPSQGEFHCHDVVGRKDENAAHGHRFVVKVKEEDVSLYFLDPEHIVGKRNFLRPQICNVLSVKISVDDPRRISMAFQRVRTAELDEEALSFPSLQNEAARMIDGSSQLVSDQRDVSFRLRVDEESAEIQSRYVGEQGIRAIASGARLPRFIEGKAATQKIILERFIDLPESSFVKRN